MKKSLVLISLAFIFLLSVSVVSAGFFDWLTGDVTVQKQSGIRPTSVAEQEKVESQTVSTTPPKIGASSSSERTSIIGSRTSHFRNKISPRIAVQSPRVGWTEVDAVSGGKCYIQQSSRSLFRR